MQSEADRILENMEKHHTRYTNIVCSGGCGKELTNNQLEYSNKVYGKPLCFSCQRLEKMLKKNKRQIRYDRY